MKLLRFFADREKIPPAGSILRPWPWPLALLIVAALAIGVSLRLFYPPELELSVSYYIPHGSTWEVGIVAVNHTDQTIRAQVAVVPGVQQRHSKSPKSMYDESLTVRVPVVLKPRERREFSCVFSMPNRTKPNATRFTVVEFKKSDF